MDNKEINECMTHYMVTANTPDTGESVTGFLVCENAIMELGCGYSFNGARMECDVKFIDPCTVSRVPVDLVKERHSVGDYRCPVCGVYFIGNKDNITKYCGNCGALLNLSDE